MAKGVMIGIRIHPDLLAEAQMAVYNIKYQKEESTAAAYKIIKENPSTPLGQLQRELRNRGDKQIRLSTMKNIAIECGLPYTL